MTQDTLSFPKGPQVLSAVMHLPSICFASLVECCCLSGPWVHLTSRIVDFSSHWATSMCPEAGQVGERRERVLGEAGIIAVSSQVCGHWAGILQSDNQ